jgi:hypothetical protein
MSDKIKTYCEQKRPQTGYINWYEVLDNLIELKRKPTTPGIFYGYINAHQRACTLSQNWVTCACGNQCSEIPRKSTGVPEDISLSMLGVQFNNHILNEHFESAKITLANIELRSQQVLREIAINKLKEKEVT